MAGPYIKPTVFSGEWVGLQYDSTPINYFQVLSGTPSSIADSKIIYSTSSIQVNSFNPQSYSFLRKRPFLENSDSLLPGPINQSSASLLTASRFSTSSEDVMYNSNFYSLISSSSTLKVEVAKRVPHLFSLQFSSLNNSKPVKLILRPFGASFGYNVKIFENKNLGGSTNEKDINAVTGMHFHNPTFDSYMAYKTPYLLPEDREAAFGLPMYSKYYQATPSSLTYFGAIRPFDFISASGEVQGTYASEKGLSSFANGVFWHPWIMINDYNFNWYNIEGVHKVKQYFYNHRDLLGVSAGQHEVNWGIDLYFTNTFNKGYLYRPDFQTTGTGRPGDVKLYDLNNYTYRPSVTGTSLFGTINNQNYSGLFTSGPVFKVEYICNSGVVNNFAPYVANPRQGLWHTVFNYDFNSVGNIYADQGKDVVASSHPYFSSVFASDPTASAASGLYDGWNVDPLYPFTSDINYGPKAGQGKPYVCPIFVLDSDNTFETTGTSDRVAVGIYTKLSPSPGSDRRPNSISIGQRREQMYAVFGKDYKYRPETLSVTSAPALGYPSIGPYTYEDINGGGYCTIYSNYYKDFTKGWKVLEYWMIIAETRDQVISKIDQLHSMGVAEPGPMDPELELPQVILDSILDMPMKGTL